ncbi:MAG: GNAT family N-acetyltransferase [Pseudomonadota bacterium]
MGDAYEPSELPAPPWRSPRLILRPFDHMDALAAHAAFDSDEAVWKFNPGYAPTLEHRKATITRFSMLHRQFGFGPCAAFLPDEGGAEGVLVGQGGLNPYIYDQRDGSRTVEWEVMYKLARPYRGKGYATEIAQFWVEFAFEVVRLRRLHICPVKANSASIAVLQRLGARFEDDWLDPDVVIATIEAS